MDLCNTKKGQALIYEGLVILITIIVITFLLYLLHSKITSLKSELELEKPNIGHLETAELTNVYLNYPIPSDIKKKYHLRNSIVTIRDLIHTKETLGSDFEIILEKTTNQFINEMNQQGFRISRSNLLISQDSFNKDYIPVPFIQNNQLSFYYISLSLNISENE